MNTFQRTEPEDFTEAEHAAVDAIAAPMIEHFEGEKKADKRFNSRNRSAWNRMNRPSRTVKIDKGYSMIDRLIEKGLKLNPVRDLQPASVSEDTPDLRPSETQGM